MSQRRVIVSAFLLILISLAITETDITGRLVKDQSTLSMSYFFATMGVILILATLFVLYVYVRKELFSH